MNQSNMPMPPAEAVKILLQKLPSKRMRDVVEKRFGLRGGKRKTLEAIGKEYKITRERVRQIEADAFRHLSREESLREVAPVTNALAAHIASYGGVITEDHLIQTLGDSASRPSILFLLDVGSQFSLVPESDNHHRLWTVDEKRAGGVARILSGVQKELKAHEKPLSEHDLHGLVSRIGEKEQGGTISDQMIETFLASSKMIKKNPYGEYGLSSWAAIRPRGVRDKADVALARAGKPMHFTDVAGAITEAAWSQRRAHPQTVHNELIKDSRFVLVGRGFYALREWGYEPGVVRDVIISALKESDKPLSKEQIIELVLQKRLVKPPTVFLNLQNKSLFKRLDNGTYTLV